MSPNYITRDEFENRFNNEREHLNKRLDTQDEKLEQHNIFVRRIEQKQDERWEQTRKDKKEIETRWSSFEDKEADTKQAILQFMEVQRLREERVNKRNEVIFKTVLGAFVTASLTGSIELVVRIARTVVYHVPFIGAPPH